MSKESQKEMNIESKKFVDNFIDFISDTGDKTSDEVDMVLQQNGIDIAKLIYNVNEMVGDALEKERLSWQKEATVSRKANAQKFSKKKQSLSKLSREELLACFNAIFQSKDQDFSFAHRNLKPEKMSEEELREILSEYEQLEDEE